MNKLLVAFTLLISASLQAGDQSICEWTKNYNHLVTLLEATPEVGECSLTLSTDPNAPEGSFDVNFLLNSGEAETFSIQPPSATNGQTQADYPTANILRYRQSDVVGWTNMLLTLDAEGKIIDVETTKTLPDGTVYDSGIRCSPAN